MSTPQATKIINLSDAPPIPGLTFRAFRGEEDYPHMLAVIEGSKDVDGAKLWERFNPRFPFQITAAVVLLTIPPVLFKFKLPQEETTEAAALPTEMSIKA